MIIAYSKSKCPQCDATIKQLDKLGVPYSIRTLDNSKEHTKFVMDLGYRQAPVVYVDEDNHWSGFQPSKIRALAEDT